MRIADVINELEIVAPIYFQESYDNAGVNVGDVNRELTCALITLDVTDEVIKEAIDYDCNLIICHHPVVFSGVKSLTGKNMAERILIKAIKNDITIYSSHTNIDSVIGGVNSKMCDVI